MRHLERVTTGRGFAHLPPIVTERDSEVRVYESNSAEGPSLWLAIDGDTSDEAIHLTADEAWQLAEQIMNLVTYHYQGDARPEKRYADLL